VQVVTNDNLRAAVADAAPRRLELICAGHPAAAATTFQQQQQ
jgi:hypothetical protein